MSNPQHLIVQGDEWWLKPEWQVDHETREEWKYRTFTMRYGRSGKLKDFYSSREPNSFFSVDEAEQILRKYVKNFDFMNMFGRGITGPRGFQAVSREMAFRILEQHYGHSIPRDE